LLCYMPRAYDDRTTASVSHSLLFLLAIITDAGLAPALHAAP